MGGHHKNLSPRLLLPSLLVLSFLLSISITTVNAVDMSKFRKCQDTDFCNRNRQLTPAPSVYHVIPGSVSIENNKQLIVADLFNSFTSGLYTLELSVYPNRILRLKVNEKAPIKPRYNRN